MIIDPKTGSHPAVRFGSHPPIQGPLSILHDGRRDQIIEEVAQRTYLDYEHRDQRSLLEETLYLEKVRLNKQRHKWWSSPYLYRRNNSDRKFYGELDRALLKDRVFSDPSRAVHQLIHHYSSEICGNYHPNVYRFATTVVPFGLSWLLNATNFNNILPWRLTESLATRIRVVGEVSRLQQLVRNGTVLMVPTHLSNIDSILIGWVIHLCSLPAFAYGAGLNLFSNPLLSFLMGNLGAYTVDRQKTSELYKSTLKNYSTTILTHGVHSIFFPGGGRCRSGAIEKHLKLGLLGTAIQAQIENFKNNKPNPNVYIVPVTMSYHFVFEAQSLVQEFLKSTGKHRFRPNDGGEHLPLMNLVNFFWKIFSARTEMWVRIGQPLDVFGNLVDENGKSMGPNGTTIEPKSWLTTAGKLGAHTSRDIEFTKMLGSKIVDRYHAENVILSSHAAAFTLFDLIKKQYPNKDVYQLLRLNKYQRRVSTQQYYEHADKIGTMLRSAHLSSRLHLSDALFCQDAKIWAEEGVKQLGMFHEDKVVWIDQNEVTTENMDLLYYYRNRMCGYGFTTSGLLTEGEYDEQGFLA